MSNNPDEIKFWVGALLFALAGGITKMMKIALKKKKPPSVFIFAANMVISGFCGMLCISLALHFKADIHVTSFVAGVAGWMGPEFIELCVKLLIKQAERLFERKPA